MSDSQWLGAFVEGGYFRKINDLLEADPEFMATFKTIHGDIKFGKNGEWEKSGMLLGHGPCAGMQVARAGVVAQTRPGRQNLVERCRGQGLHRGPAFDEFPEVVADRRHRGLLQHDLRQPHEIGLGLRPGRGAPGQGATMAVVPGKQS